MHMFSGGWHPECRPSPHHASSLRVVAPVARRDGGRVAHRAYTDRELLGPNSMPPMRAVCGVRCAVCGVRRHHTKYDLTVRFRTLRRRKRLRETLMSDSPMVADSSPQRPSRYCIAALGHEVMLGWRRSDLVGQFAELIVSGRLPLVTVPVRTLSENLSLQREGRACR